MILRRLGMNLEILTNKSAFINHTIDKLGVIPIDFHERANFIKRQKNAWRAAGVLIPLVFCPDTDEFFQWRLILIKRSATVVQAGDLSCPGGMLDRKDFFLNHLITSRLVPILKGKPLDYAQKRGPADYKKIALFLTTALRESWEEVHLNPFHVDFLGPLPCRNLVMFTKTIFPVVGFVNKPWLLRPNHEVEKILEIPLMRFFQIENYAYFNVETLNLFDNGFDQNTVFPCFLQPNESGQDDILWGATFSIILTFLKTVFDFDAPVPTREIHKTKLHPDYLSGSGRSLSRNARIRQNTPS